MVRWWIVGLFFTGLNIPLLGLFKEVLGFPDWSALLLASEVGTLLRYFANDYWVFGYPKPSWKRCWQYHIANASSFFIWWLASLGGDKLLTLMFGKIIWKGLDLNLYIASIIGTGVSVGWSMLTNFVWIWRTNTPENESISQDDVKDAH